MTSLNAEERPVLPAILATSAEVAAACARPALLVTGGLMILGLTAGPAAGVVSSVVPGLAGIPWWIAAPVALCHLANLLPFVSDGRVFWWSLVHLLARGGGARPRTDRQM